MLVLPDRPFSPTRLLALIVMEDKPFKRSFPFPMAPRIRHAEGLSRSLEAVGCGWDLLSVDGPAENRGLRRCLRVPSTSTPARWSASLLARAWHCADGFSPMLKAPSQFVEGGKKAGKFWNLFWPSFTAMSGY